MASVGQHQAQNHNSNHHSSKNIDGNNQESTFSDSTSQVSAEQDNKISSSNHLNHPVRNLNLNQSSSNSTSDVGTDSGPRVFLCGTAAATTSPTMDNANGHEERVIGDSVGVVVEGGNERRCLPDSDHDHVSSVALNSSGLGPGPGPSVSPGARNSNGSISTSDYSISSSTNPSFSVGGAAVIVGESSDLETSEESSTNYRTPCVPEDDAGSSSHSEVRSSSPGLADADADVEDSPSGSEETGSESERGGNSASVMYAPNTVGFPPSRSSLTHCIPTGGCFANTSKFSGGNNPFAVKGLSTGNISSSSGGSSLSNTERCSSSSSTGSQNINPLVGNSLPRSSPIVAGRWGTIQQQKPSGSSWNSRPIIRPSALGSSLGGGGVTSSTSGSGVHSAGSNSASHSHHHHHPNYFSMNDMDSDSTGGITPSDNTTATSSSFVLRPPKLPNPFTQASPSSQGTASQTGGDSSSERSEAASELPPYSAPTASASSNTPGLGQPQSSKDEESLAFVPLAKEDGTSADLVSTSSSSAPVVSVGQSTTTNLFSNMNGSPSSISSFANSSTATTASTPSSSFKLATGSQDASSTPSSGGFVFGSNLQQRVSDSSVPNTSTDQEELPSTNGISSSSPPSASGGLFFAALRNVQGNAVKSVGGASSSQEMRNTMSGAGSSAFADMAESHADRKRRFDDAPVITGEEDEFNVIQIICRLFAFDTVTSSWLERGRGQLRLNDRNELNNELRSRLIVRTKGSLRLMLNTNVWAGMKVDRASNKSVRFTANDNGNIKLFLVMATVGEADQLFQALDWRVKTLKTLEDKQSSVGGCSTSAALDSTSCSRMARRMSESQHLVLDSTHSDQTSKLLSVASSGTLQPDSDDDDEDDDDDFLVDDDDEEDENEDLNESPSTKKKRLSACPDPSSDGQGELGSEVGSSSVSPTRENTFSSSSSSLIRQTPTIRINNHEMKDLDEGGDLLD